MFSLAFGSVIGRAFAVLLLFLHRRNAQIVASVVHRISVKVVDAHDARAFSVSPRVHNDLMDEDMIVAVNIPVCCFIPRYFLALVVVCLVVQYFLIARWAQFAVFVWLAVHDDCCDFAGLRVCDFPEGIFHLVGGASERFCVAWFEGHGGGGGGGSGSVFVTDVFVLFLEVEHCGERNE